MQRRAAALHWRWRIAFRQARSAAPPSRPGMPSRPLGGHRAKAFLSIVRGRPNRNAVPNSGYNSYNANTMTLDMEGTLNLDGEMFDVAGPVDISASLPLEFLQL